MSKKLACGMLSLVSGLASSWKSLNRVSSSQLSDPALGTRAHGVVNKYCGRKGSVNEWGTACAE